MGPEAMILFHISLCVHWVYVFYDKIISKRKKKENATISLIKRPCTTFFVCRGVRRHLLQRVMLLSDPAGDKYIYLTWKVMISPV